MSRILFALLGLMLIPVSLLAQKDSLGTIVDEVMVCTGMVTLTVRYQSK